MGATRWVLHFRIDDKGGPFFFVSGSTIRNHILSLGISSGTSEAVFVNF